jgi:hypothetical protein
MKPKYDSNMMMLITRAVREGSLNIKFPTHLLPLTFATSIKITEGKAQISAKIASFSILFFR